MQATPKGMQGGSKSIDAPGKYSNARLGGDGNCSFSSSNDKLVTTVRLTNSNAGRVRGSACRIVVRSAFSIFFLQSNKETVVHLERTLISFFSTAGSRAEWP